MSDIDQIALDAVKAIGNIDPDKLPGGRTQAVAQAQILVRDAINGEVEALKAANRDLQDWFDDARATAEQAQARVAELEAESLQAVANKVCGELPEGWVINLCMENGAAWVEAIKPSGYTIEIDGADLTLENQVMEALNQASELEAGGER